MENMGLDIRRPNQNQTKKKKKKHQVRKQRGGGKGVIKPTTSKKKKKKLLIKRVFDYLTCDSYMYAPLLPHHHHPAPSQHSSLLPTAGPLDYIKRVASRILTRPRKEKDKRASGQGHHQAIGDDRSENLLEQENDKPINVSEPGADVYDVGRQQQTIGHFEIVKHIVHQRDLLLSRPGHCIVDNPKDFVLGHKSSKELGFSA